MSQQKRAYKLLRLWEADKEGQCTQLKQRVSISPWTGARRWLQAHPCLTT